jgi:fervidolysin-like protein
MKTSAWVVVLCTLLNFPGCIATEPTALQAEPAASRGLERRELVADEIMVKFKPSTKQERIAALIHTMRLAIISHDESLNLYRLRVLGDRPPLQEVIEQLSLMPEVEYAEPNYRRHADP